MIIVTGHKSGLGKELASVLPDVIGWSLPEVDVRDRTSVLVAAANAPSKIDVLINCAGINRINWFKNVSEREWDDVIDTNLKGIYMTTRALLDKLRNGTIINIVSNASHVPMTCSAAYNASKGGALMLTKSLARELIKTHNITVFAISPNKLKGTGMSRDIESAVMSLRGWTAEQARAYQLASLPSGEETDPKELAEYVAYLLATKQRHKHLAGCEIAFGGP